MRALCFENDRLRLRDVPRPEPGPDEASVRVLVAGICNTDVEIARGYMGFTGVLGHEFVGVVEEAPDASLVGKRVAGEINLACGQCDACHRGLGRHCPTRTVLGILGKNGCFAEHVTLPARNLHVIPDGIADETAVFVEPLAAAFEVPELVHVEPASRVLVVGDGKLGLLCAAVLRQTGCALTVVGRHDHKLAIAARQGIETREPQALTGRSFDVVVEATGSPSGLAYALDRVRPRGTVVLKSTFHGEPQINTAKIVIDEIRILGSRCGPFEAAVRALARGQVDPAPLVDSRHGLDGALEAFERATSKGVLKVLLDMR